MYAAHLTSLCCSN